MRRHLPKANCAFYPVNTQALLEYVRRRKQTTRTIEWTAQPLATDDGYVGLVSLPKYVEFLKDEDGDLNEMIFESNVRGYQGSTAINRAIATTLRVGGPPNFWLLNNGVTVITEGKVLPTSPLQMSIEDPQVVNGLQTSRQVFDHFSGTPATADNRAVLVKVLPVTEPRHRDAIIQATNSQNAMSSGSLRATDYVHNQIEDLFKNYGLYYDRKKGFHRDQGAPIAAIVSVTELVQALVSIIQARPDSARARPGDYINKDPEYRKIFGRDKIPLGAYYKCVHIVRSVDEFLRSVAFEKGEQRNFKYYVSCVLTAELTKRVHPNADEVLAIETTSVNAATINQAFDTVDKHYADLIEKGVPPDAIAKGSELLRVLKTELSAKHTDATAPSTKTRKRKPRDVLAEGGLLK